MLSEAYDMDIDQGYMAIQKTSSFIASGEDQSSGMNQGGGAMIISKNETHIFDSAVWAHEKILEIKAFLKEESQETMQMN